MSDLLTVEDLHIRFPTRTGVVEAVRGLSFSLGRERLGVMGYDLDDLLAELASLPATSRFLASDALKIPYDYAYRTLELGMAGRSARRIAQRRFPLQAHK